MSKQELVDVHPVKLSLKESQDSEKVKLEGVFGKVNKENRNGREYPKEVMKEEIDRLRPKIKERALTGHLDHPEGLETKLKESSHVITDLRIEGNRIVGELEALSNQNGRELQALADDNIQLGISSRGEGSLVTENGREVVQDDYRLITFDVVSDPSVTEAKPDVVMESINRARENQAENLEEEYPDAVRKIKEQAKEEVKENLKEDLKEEVEEEIEEQNEEEIKEEVQNRLDEKKDELYNEIYNDINRRIEEQVDDLREREEERIRSELLSDPEVGFAKKAVENIVEEIKPFIVPEDEREIVEAQKQKISELSDLVVEAYETLDQVEEEIIEKRKLEKAVSKANSAIKTLKLKFDKLEENGRKEDRDLIKEQRKEIDKLEQQQEELRKEVEKKGQKLKETKQMARELGKRAMIERELADYQHSDRARELLEGQDLEDVDTLKEQINRIKKTVESEQQKAAKDLNETRSDYEKRLDELEEKMSGLQRQNKQLEEEAKRKELKAKIEREISDMPNKHEVRKRINEENVTDFGEALDIIEQMKEKYERDDSGGQLFNQVKEHQKRQKNRREDVNKDLKEERQSETNRDRSRSTNQRSGNGKLEEEMQTFGVNLEEMKRLAEGEVKEEDK